MQGDPPSPRSGAPVPWQLWVVIAVLVMNGIGNAMQISARPIAAAWLAANALFVFGLIRRWRLIYVLFVLVSASFMIWIAPSDPFSGLMALVLLLLVASQYRWFFPTRPAPTIVASNQVV